MKTYKYIYSGKLLLMLFAAMFMVNCSDDSPASGDDTQQGDNNNGDGNKEDEKIQTISVNGILAQQSASRAGWEVTPDGNISAIWGASTTDVKTVVSGKDGFKKFEDEKLYSETDVTASSDNKQSATLNIKSKITDTYAAGDYVYSFNTAENTSVETSETLVKYSLAIPAELSQSQPDDISHISSYGYVLGKGTVSEDVKSASLQFDILPSVLRLGINNNSEQNFTVTSVKVNGKFSNSADITLNKDGQIAYSYTQEENAVGITVNTADMLIANGSSAYVYTAIFPTKYQDSEILEFVIEGTRGTESVTFTKTYSCSSLKPSDASEFEFASNHNYTISMDITINGMDNVNVTIDDFVPGQGSAVTDSKSCWFVKPDGTSVGTSWNAASSLEIVLSKANDGDVIYVAAGDYTISKELSIRKNICIIGGYAGNEVNLDNPDPYANGVTFTMDNAADIRCFNINNTSDNPGTIKISGINFKNFGSDSYAGNGSAILVSDSKADIVLDNLSFTDCKVSSSNKNNGGAIFIGKFSGSNISIDNCNFSGCAAYDGGAMYIDENVSNNNSFIINNSIFNDNYSEHNGGAINIRPKNTININNSLFSCNSTTQTDSSGSGGAIYVQENDVLNLNYCTLYDNFASMKGSVIYGPTDSHRVNIENCIIVDNIAARKNNSRFALDLDNVTFVYNVKNSIISNNKNRDLNAIADLHVPDGSLSIIQNSIVNNVFVTESSKASEAAPSSGTISERYLTEEQVSSLKLKLGISENEIRTFVKQN